MESNNIERVDDLPLFITTLGTVIYLPLEDLMIGDSFFIPTTSARLISTQTHFLAKKWGYKFVAKEEICMSMLGVRFWRVA